MNDLIYNVKYIFKPYLEENSKKYYNIPEYQRGYKWDNKQIKQLLEDIQRFDKHSNSEHFYCLQNITIVDKGDYYNIVDGQQRLTSLLIILSCLGESGLVKNKIQYSVRPKTDEFIQNYIINRAIENNKWEDFLHHHQDKDFDHQDIYYLFNAYNTIKEWFKDKDQILFKEKLLNDVKLIINKPKIDNEQELFTNLNSGKVSLDGADLIRAILITNVPKNGLDADNMYEIKNIVFINEHRARIGHELDQISAWWSQNCIKKYFDWANMVNAPENETVSFDSNTNPINTLYKLYILSKGKKEIRLKDFEDENYAQLYHDLQFIHRTLQDWYKDCKIYHYVRFLIHTCKNNPCYFTLIWQKWISYKMTKTNFIEWLETQINEEIKELLPLLREKIEQENKISFSYKEDWYSNENLPKILILLDIIQIINSQDSNKLSFLPAPYFKAHTEDREHIFPQTPISEKDIRLKNRESLEEKIKKYKEILLMENINVDLPDLHWEIPGLLEDELKTLKDEINNAIHSKIYIHSIGNLCLLKDSVNRAYGNDFYTQKRSDIIKNVKNGKYIRPHTLNTFDKWYAKDRNEITQYDRWSNKDIQDNVDYIEKTITEYFNNTNTRDESNFPQE